MCQEKDRTSKYENKDVLSVADIMDALYISDTLGELGAPLDMKDTNVFSFLDKLRYMYPVIGNSKHFGVYVSQAVRFAKICKCSVHVYLTFIEAQVSYCGDKKERIRFYLQSEAGILSDDSIQVISPNGYSKSWKAANNLVTIKLANESWVELSQYDYEIIYDDLIVLNSRNDAIKCIGA